MIWLIEIGGGMLQQLAVLFLVITGYDLAKLVRTLGLCSALVELLFGSSCLPLAQFRQNFWEA